MRLFLFVSFVWQCCIVLIIVFAFLYFCVFRLIRLCGRHNLYSVCSPVPPFTPRIKYSYLLLHYLERDLSIIVPLFANWSTRWHEVSDDFLEAPLLPPIGIARVILWEVSRLAHFEGEALWSQLTSEDGLEYICRIRRIERIMSQLPSGLTFDILPVHYSLYVFWRLLDFCFTANWRLRTFYTSCGALFLDEFRRCELSLYRTQFALIRLRVVCPSSDLIRRSIIDFCYNLLGPLIEWSEDRAEYLTRNFVTDVL